jgi:DNA-directed RNA polymerase subunit RPC12/RpoP
MGLYNEVSFLCPRCGKPTWEQTRIGDCYGQIIDLKDTSDEIKQALLDPTRVVHCQHCSVRVAFVKKVTVELVPVTYESLPKDPTPEEIQRVQDYLARRHESGDA